MGVVDKTVDTAGGAVVGGAKGAVIGALVTIAAPAVILGGIGLLGGLATAGVLAVVGAALGVAASVSGATFGGAIGAIGGAAKKLFGGKAEPEPQIDQMLAAERERSKALTAQLVERAQTAAGFDNPEAMAGHAAKVQAAGVGQEGFVAKTQAAANDSVMAQRA